MSRLFGTDGVRGIVGKEMTHEVALRLGLAVGTHHKPGSTIAVGRDARLSGPMLASAAVAGLLAAGCNVVRLGIVPTPGIQLYAAAHEKVDAALIITASHNPAEWNGIKYIAGDGTEAGREDEEHVEELYQSGKFRLAGWDKVGQLEDDEGAKQAYLDTVHSKVDAAAIQRRRFHAVVDPAGGPGCLTTPDFIRRLGGTVTLLHGELDPFFRGRKPEPTEDNLSKLKAKVKEAKADFGVAHDGDADRAVFVDDQGDFVSGDQSFALLARHVMRKSKGGVLCTPVSTSSMVEEVVKKEGGRVVYTAVGSPIVGRRMRTEKASFGGEENGGLIFPQMQYCRDALMSCAAMMEMLAVEGKPLSQLRKELPQYAVVKTKIECPDDQKKNLIGAVKRWVREQHPTAKVDETDGIKIYFEDGWVLARPSGTEPIFRVYAESKQPARAKALADEFIGACKSLLVRA
jgi:phosphomannomutase / phosphoglucomutase